MIEWVTRTLGDAPIMHLIDILIVWYICYYLLQFVQGTRAINLLKGVGVIIVAKFLSSILQLTTLNWLLGQVINWGVVAVIILFQPELRKGLEILGRDLFRNRRETLDPSEKMINDLETSLIYMSRRKIGALISIESEDSLQEFIETGIAIDAVMSSQLLINIFIPNTPLHDGAVIVRDFKVAAASCFLPLSESDQIPKDLGTRHRAAIGLSEATDAITLIVSEETGDISLVQRDHFHRGIDRKELRDILKEYLNYEEDDDESDEETTIWSNIRHFFRQFFS